MICIYKPISITIILLHVVACVNLRNIVLMDQGIPTGPSYERNNSSRRPTLHDINGLKKLSVLASSSQRNLNSSISNISLHKSNSLAPVIKSKRTHVSPPPDRKLIEIRFVNFHSVILVQL